MTVILHFKPISIFKSLTKKFFERKTITVTMKIKKHRSGTGPRPLHHPYHILLFLSYLPYPHHLYYHLLFLLQPSRAKHIHKSHQSNNSFPILATNAIYIYTVPFLSYLTIPIFTVFYLSQVLINSANNIIYIPYKGLFSHMQLTLVTIALKHRHFLIYSILYSPICIIQFFKPFIKSSIVCIFLFFI